MALLAAWLSGSRVSAAVVSVSSGGDHTMFVMSDGTLAGMGGNFAGQLGDQSIVFKTARPRRIAGGVRSVAAGRAHTLFVKTDGTLWAMGDNSVGQLGDGTTTERWSPVQVASGVTQVATRSATRSLSEGGASGSHTLFIKADRTLWATGANHRGQLGDGTKQDRVWPVQVATDVAAVGVGTHYTMFIKTDGTLWRMGRSIAAGATVDHVRPVQLASGVTSVACGRDKAVIVRNDHTLWEFGNDFEARVLVTESVRSAAYGTTHLAFVKTDGTLWARGADLFGEVGDGPTTSAGAPVQIANAVISVAAAGYQTFFIKEDSSLWGSGRNELGQLGDGSTDDRASPVEVPQVLGLPSIGLSPESQAVYPRQPVTLTVYASGTPPLSYQWSKDGVDLVNATESTYSLPEVAHGDLGTYRVRVSNALGTTPSDAADLLVVSPIQRVKSVAVANDQTFVLQENGSLWATGTNEFGELGDGTTDTRYALTKIAGGVTSVSAGQSHTLFVKADGTLWGMGSNIYGDGTAGELRLVPKQLAAGVSAVSAGRDHAMFIKTDGSLWGMGHNDYGQLGTAPSGFSGERTPVRVAQGVASVSAGDSHTAFVKVDGTLWAMGDLPDYNDGTPVQIATDVVSCSAGENHTLFIRKDGSLWGYGSGHSGELAPAWGTQRDPVQLATGVAAAVAVKGGIGSVYIKSDGTLWAMGGNNATGRYGAFAVALDEQTYLGYENVAAVAASGGHTVFVRRDGSAWGMGQTSLGRLGLGLSLGRQAAWRPVRLCHTEDMPFFEDHPANASAAHNGAVFLDGTLREGAGATHQWLRNGAELPSENRSSLTVSGLQPANAGLYSLIAVNSIGDVASDPAIVGLISATKVTGDGTELQPANIVHPNGNIFDQVLLQGAAASITSDFEQSHVTRMSYIDPDDDIVQVEFSGPGTLTLVLSEASGPAAPVHYNQPGVSYMKGRALIVIAGADERTNVSVFTVGRATAFDPTGQFRFLEPISPTNDPARNGSALFVGHQDTAYDGIADIAFIAISSSNGKFGGVRTANTHYAGYTGLVGIYAPGVTFQGPVIVGEINASDQARPALVLGAASDVRVAGGDVMQANGMPVEVSGIAELRFTAGSDSHARALPAQKTSATFTQIGRDVTELIVVDP